MFKRILVPFDGSDKSRDAFDLALELASLQKPTSTIFAVSVVQPPESLYFVDMSGAVDAAMSHYEQMLGELAAKAREKGLFVKTEVVIGHPADKIVKMAAEKGCDLIVVGHKGRSAIEGFLLGSVSRRVAAEAGCTVTIVK
ncbi:MAG: universal stress protein [Nitrospiraceae bacterium]|nr:universal stress protein [Nitrospiraceae bacterium]